jgi:hypothetical protein
MKRQETAMKKMNRKETDTQEIKRQEREYIKKINTQ